MLSSRVSVEPQYGQRNAALELDERRASPPARGAGGAKPARAELLAALGRDVVGRPRVVEEDADLGLAAERLDRLAPARARIPSSAGQPMNVGVNSTRTRSSSTRDVLDDAEVDERDHGDLRVRDLGERLPDVLLERAVASTTARPAGAERRTDVISSQQLGELGLVHAARDRLDVGERAAEPLLDAAASSGRSSSSSTPSAYGQSSSTASSSRARPSSAASRRSIHISACMRW